MSWLDRLFRRLPRPAWSRDGQGVACFSVSCDGTGLVWQVADGTLTLTPSGGTASPYSSPLAAYPTLAALLQALGQLPGYTVASTLNAAYRLLSPLCLMEGSGSTADPGGGNIQIATSPQYQVLLAIGGELAAAGQQIPNLSLQMSTPTAVGAWLDYLGSFFSVPRVPGEQDSAYAVRIIQETIRPKCNNVSMARALQEYTGVSAQVTDAVSYVGEPNLLNGAFALDGSHNLSGGSAVAVGGFFNVEAGYDLITSNQLPNLAAVLTAYINRLKAGGTALLNLTLAPLSALQDPAPVPNDANDSLSISYGNKLDGSYRLDGTNILAGGLTFNGTLSGS